ncbi:MAG TPA: S8 family serine peptidase [Actinophytocola sp.]|jgi:subtilisin family serine protease|uniref:S8 family peptidase n=1 Tax=Actinophytocola sp. TaxID=1872138 RepID=UPI002F943F1D
MIHDRARARVAGLLAVATAAAGTLVLGGSAAASGAGAPGASSRPAAASRTVTLLTGDRVTLAGSRVVVRGAKGREHVRFLNSTDEHGDVHVVPQDVAPRLAAGKLDPRLFDVTELVRDGYDDARRRDLPLIVDYAGATPRAAGAEVTRNLPAVSAVAVRADKSTLFWAGAGASARKIWLDGPVRASLDHSVPQIGAPEAWAAGYTGKGATVAVLDTGIDASHPDLADAVAGAKDFTGSETGTDDYFGHGTHVASIITGSGAKSGGRYKGVAPDAKLLNGKVLDDFGGGQESGIIAGMEWAANSGADVINMSLGSPFPSDGTDPMSQAVNRLTQQTGALFVIAAGNSGGEETIGSPAAADAALTVGAVDDEDRLADFSSAGPRLGDGAIKPDLTAPGVDIVAARAAHAQPIGEPAEDGYMSLSGTSMATPHVAGAAAIVAGEHPDWTAAQLKSTLMATAKPTDGTVFQQGAGRVDVAAAVRGTVATVPASVSAGVAQWPHDDDQPIAKTLAYTNAGAEPVTLDVASEMTGPGGAAPAGMFTVSPSRVTVPAGGRAEVTLTIDTRVAAPDGVYTGSLTATGGAVPVHTPVAVTREVESYDVTVRSLDHDGKPTPEYSFRFVDIDHPKAYFPYDESGTVVARLPKGRFYFEEFVQTARGDDDWLLTQYVEPDYVVDRDAEIVVDARDGKRPGFTVDEPDAALGRAVLSFGLSTPWGGTGVTMVMSNFDGLYVTPSKTSSDAFTFQVEGELAEPDGSAGQYSFYGSPYLYHLRWHQDGSVPAGLTRTVHDRQLGKAITDHAAAVPGVLGVRDQFLTNKLPFRLTEFYTPGEKWYDDFMEAADPNDFPATVLTTATGQTYRKGKVAHQQWNHAVLGPAFPVFDGYPDRYAARLGDEVQVDLPLRADQSPAHDGWDVTAQGTTELLRDGQPVGSSDYPGLGEFTLPPEPATYTLRTSGTAPGSGLSTSVSAEWTFRSAHVDGAAPAPLPLLAVRFAPKLDSSNAAPAGRFRFPVYVQRNGSARPGRLHEPRVEVSYDDGKTWSAVRLTRHDGGWLASVDHPAGTSFVSLRGSVADRDGNSVTQTVIRAYAVK